MIRNQIDEIRFLRLRGKLSKGEGWEASQDRRRVEATPGCLNPKLLSHPKEFDDECEKGAGQMNLG